MSQLLIGTHSSIGKEAYNPINNSVYGVKIFDAVTVAVLCHGVGVPRKREAAQLVLDTALDILSSLKDENEFSRLIEQVSKISLEKVIQLNKEGNYYTGVNCAIAALINNCLYIANCGECRIFLKTGAEIKQICKTHTSAEALIEYGYLTIEVLDSGIIYDGVTHKMIADDEELAVFSLNTGLEVKSGDEIILCNGFVFGHWLNKKTWDKFQEAFLAPHDHPQQAVDNFMQWLVEDDPYRNFTMIAFKIP